MYERIVRVDGRPLTRTALCPTVPPSIGPVRHVLRRVPCPLDAPDRVRLDTRTLADGSHTVLARVEDLGGNVRTDEAAILVDNRPPRRGTVALVGEAATSEALTAVPSGFTGEDVAYEYRWQRCDAAGEGCTRDRRRRRAHVRAAVRRRRPPRPRRGHRVRRRRQRAGACRRRARIVTGPGTGPAGGFSAGSAPPDRLTAWLERGSRRLRSTTVRWPARVRIRGRLTDRRRSPPAARDGADARARRRAALARDRRRLRTRSDGRLTTFTRIGPSRHLRLVSGRRLGDAAPPRAGERSRARPAVRAR